MVLAGPVAMDQFDLFGKGFVESSVVKDEQAAEAVDILLSFAPQRRGIRFETLKKAREGVVGGAVRPFGVDARGFGARDHLGCGDKKVDVVEISHFGCIHRCMIAHNVPTA